MFAQFFGEFLHLVGKGFVVVFHRLRAHVATGGEHMAVLGDFGQGHAAAKTGLVEVVGDAGARFHLATPGGDGFGNAGDGGIVQLCLHAGFIGAGFLGGLVTGFAAGFVALWISRWKVAKGVRGIMPVVVIPLLSSLVIGVLMLVLLGRPIAAAMDGLTDWLGGLQGGSIILLGALLGAMMGFDLGGPVNKVAYTFGVTGLATAGLTPDSPQYKVMAAVMLGGMVAPLALALATVLRPRLFTEVERENGKAAWLLGASFISEGAIPFAAADPWRVILASTVGSAVTGAVSMGMGVSLVAPHGGVWVLPLVGNALGFVVAILAGVAVASALVVLLKQTRRVPVAAAGPVSAGQDA